MRASSVLVVLALAGCGAAAGAPSAARAPSTTTISTSGTMGNGTAAGSGGMVVFQTVAEERVVTATVPARADVAWAALPAAFQEVGIPVRTMDTESQAMGNLEHVVTGRMAGGRVSRYFNCGSGPFGDALADSYRVQVAILVKLSPQEDLMTRMDTQVAASARDPSTSSPPVRCTSTGQLEKLLTVALQKRVATRG